MADNPPLASAASPIASSSSSSSSSVWPYPYATAPDIIRAHQKDAYFKGTLANTLSDLQRRFLGARSAHTWSLETRTAADTLYLALTTLVGNRTLGEEYCDVVQIDDSPSGRGRLPSLSRRASYIAASVLIPYCMGRLIPGLRSRIRRRLEARLAHLSSSSSSTSAADANSSPIPHKRREREKALWRYILAHLPTLTSSAPLQALTLATFYFSGTYYELAKRLLGLRYIFTHSVSDSPDRVGYEVLGVLLLIQLSVQGYLHAKHTLSNALRSPSLSSLGDSRRENASAALVISGSSNVSLNEDGYAANTNVLLGDAATGATAGRVSRARLAKLTHTVLPRRDQPSLSSIPEHTASFGAQDVGGDSSDEEPAARYDLHDEKVMAFVAGKQQRKCTLCLEPMRDPAATACGHVFCWECIGDWVREKPECPLCRRDAAVQHILPLRTG